jgi:aspartate/methionine/tyrosine aminotransferase
MFVRTRYLAWALQFYGKVPYDLASSGVPHVKAEELGTSHVDVDDVGAFQELRRAIARYNAVAPEEVVPALGTSHAIFLAYAAMLSPGDEILVESPGYEPLTRAAEGMGATVRTFERREEDGYRVVPERVAAAIGPRTRAIVVSTLHNPTGVRVDDATIRELSAIADARGAWVLVDEVYAAFDDLADDGVFRRSSRRLANNVVAVSSLTKCYGLGMYRLGWVLGPEAIVAGAEAAAMATVGHLPLHHACLGLAAFAALDRLSRRAKDRIAGKREIVESWVRSLPNARWSSPREGLFGLVTLPGRGDLLERIEARAREAGVLVAAGSFFGAPESFRVSWASCAPEELAEGLDRLSPIAAA